MTEVLPLIIGQAPARKMAGKDWPVPAFTSASGAKLAKLAGVGTTGSDLQDHFKTVNLCSRYMGKSGKGDKFDLAAAKQEATVILEQLRQTNKPHTVLLMGRSVAKAFGMQKHDYLQPFMVWRHVFVVFPHPSGVNRWWNEQWNVHAAEKMLRDIVAGRPILFG